ncbi:DNA-binding protein [Variovorax ureilyticus]|uniref:DNA-binding protein n=1 Tax=Variovorax ureilyticus TaxID=1836198 RepID=A0ABU8VSQ0_9BURK
MQAIIAALQHIRGARLEGFRAADTLLAEGLRPTLERVRQKMGRGSPNTVSPMLERWVALGARLAGGANPSANLAAGNDADGVPVSVRNRSGALWRSEGACPRAIHRRARPP